MQNSKESSINDVIPKGEGEGLKIIIWHNLSDQGREDWDQKFGFGLTGPSQFLAQTIVKVGFGPSSFSDKLCPKQS